MKIKHVIASLSLSLVTAFGVAVGFGAHKEAKAVKADDLKTAMFSMSLDATEVVSAYETSNYRVHVWGTNIEEYLPMHQSGQTHVYTVIIYLTDSQTVSGAQFMFYQTDGANSGDKYSENLNLYNSDSDSDVIDKDHNNGISYTFASTTNWTDGHWETSDRYVVPVPKVAHTPAIGQSATWYEFELEPENHRYAYYGMEISAANTDMVSFEYPASKNSFIFHPYYMLNKYAEEFTEGVSGSSYWTYLNSAGTYDIFIEDYFDGEGIISIRKHEESESWIFYMTESNEETVDYIYSWGAKSQFGGFPGTKIVEIEGVEEVTNGGELHFQGYDRLIYRIPVTIGYPNGDSMFMFSNGTDEYKSAEREIIAEHAYWWSGDANHLAAQFLDTILTFESYLKKDTEFESVCNMVAQDAAYIVGVYNSWYEAEPELTATYLDSSEIYTWKDSTKSAKEYVSYKRIVEQLGKIANIPVSGSSMSLDTLDLNSNNNVAIIIIACSVTSVLALTLLLVFKKKRHI